MIKTLLILSVMTSAAFCSSAFAFKNKGEQRYCSSQMIYRDGQFRFFARIDCEYYQGPCLQEIKDESTGEFNWTAVDTTKCDEAEAQQNK